MTMSWFALLGEIRHTAAPVGLGHIQRGQNFDVMVEREDLKSRQGQVRHVVSINPSEGARPHVLKVMFKRNQSRLLSGRACGGVGGEIGSSRSSYSCFSYSRPVKGGPKEWG